MGICHSWHAATCPSQHYQLFLVYHLGCCGNTLLTNTQLYLPRNPCFLKACHLTSSCNTQTSDGSAADSQPLSGRIEVPTFDLKVVIHWPGWLVSAYLQYYNTGSDVSTGFLLVSQSVQCHLLPVIHVTSSNQPATDWSPVPSLPLISNTQGTSQSSSHSFELIQT